MLLFDVFTESLKRLVIKVRHLNELLFCDLLTICFGIYSSLIEQYKNEESNSVIQFAICWSGSHEPTFLSYLNNFHMKSNFLMGHTFLYLCKYEVENVHYILRNMDYILLLTAEQIEL